MQITAELLPGRRGADITALHHSWQCLSNQNKRDLFFNSGFSVQIWRQTVLTMTQYTRDRGRPHVLFVFHTVIVQQKHSFVQYNHFIYKWVSYRLHSKRRDLLCRTSWTRWIKGGTPVNSCILSTAPSFKKKQNNPDDVIGAIRWRHRHYLGYCFADDQLITEGSAARTQWHEQESNKKKRCCEQLHYGKCSFYSFDPDYKENMIS